MTKMKPDTFTKLAFDEAKNFKYDEKLLKRPLVYGYTIDGPTSKDLDDAIMLIKNDDSYTLQVSIADVSSAIEINSELYKCAYEKVETLYRRDFNLPMLPRILSERKLSLTPEKVKPTITFEIEIGADLEVINLKITETAFKSIRRLNYFTFDTVMKEENSFDAKLFGEMAELAINLLQKRRSKGALAIYDLTKGYYTNEEGQVVKLIKEHSCISYIVIQEFMILTNKAVASFCALNNIPLLFRNHSVRQIAPGRQEIMSQMNMAIDNPQIFNAVSSKMYLWFEKAVYSPYLKGHFGLNEPAYCHVTSPIRRFADVINHYSIKAYINKTNFEFDFNQLITISNHINEIIAQHKEEDSNYFKERSLISNTQKISELNSYEIENLNDSDFIQLLRTALSFEECDENVKVAVLNRIKEYKFDIYLVYLVLTKSKIENDSWKELFYETFKFIYFNKGFPFQILNIMKQKQFLSSVIVEESTDGINFSANLRANYEDLEIIGTKAVSTKKKDALHFASAKLIAEIFKIPKDKFDELTNNDSQIFMDSTDNSEIEKIETSFNENQYKSEFQVRSEKTTPIQDYPPETKNDNDSTDYDPNFNYIGELLELLSKNGIAKQPEFTFTTSGPHHQVMITCDCTYNYENNNFFVSGSSTNKKSAKQIASYKLIKEIRELLPASKKKEIEILPDKIDDNFNYVGRLAEICLKGKFSISNYYFHDVSSKTQQQFRCGLRLFYDNEWQDFNDFANTKKQAKQKVSKQCLNFIKENINNLGSTNSFTI